MTKWIIQDCLFYPKARERKGNRQTERTSFFITSSEWKASEQLKIKKRKKKAKQKEERKRIRLENKKKERRKIFKQNEEKE